MALNRHWVLGRVAGACAALVVGGCSSRLLDQNGDSGSATTGDAAGGGVTQYDGDVQAADGSGFPPFAISSLDGSSVAYQVDIAHTGNQPNSKLTPPLTRQWSVDLGGDVSYPLVVAGRVFVTIGSLNLTGAKAEALDLKTGETLWGPIDIAYSPEASAHAAYDQGRVYVMNGLGAMTALDAATGATLWVRIMDQDAFTSPPTGAGGMVFVGGGGFGGTFYAMDGATGKLRWKAAVENGDDSSPAVTLDGVYVSYVCKQVYRFAPLDGKILWHHNGACEGGGGATPVFFEDRLWVRDPNMGNLVLDAKTGDTLAPFTADAIPAFAGNRGFFRTGTKLQAVDVDSSSVSWTFIGDGMLASPPLVVNDVVYVGSASGMIYGVDPATGAQVWSDMAPSGIDGADDWVASYRPLSGLGAGDDALVVPTGTHLVCYR